MTFPKVTILMATYNGAVFFREQINSIIGQTYTNWELLIRDDNSTDGTMKLILEAVKEDPRIKMVIDPSDVHSACANFSSLLSWAKANTNIEYVMFCDQDDIWLASKIECSLKKLQETEVLNVGKPCLVYGHLNMMSEDGAPLSEVITMSSPPLFNNIIVQNPMFGCTMMFNAALSNLIQNIPLTAENHDYWIALVAVSFGCYAIINEDIILYRQHTNNVTSQGTGFMKRFHRYYDNTKQIKELKTKLVMLGDFYDQYYEKLEQGNKTILEQFLKAFKAPTPLLLLRIIYKHKIYKITKLQTIAMLSVMINNYFAVRKVIVNHNFLYKNITL